MSKAPTDFTAQGFLSVFDGQTCLGHLVLRGKVGVEAFNSNDESLGIFSNQKAAADAISEAVTLRASLESEV